MPFAAMRKVRFADVDAAGILYYPRFFEFCHNAFEECFDERGPFGYAELIAEHRIGFPAVKVEGQFLSPLQHGDEAMVTLSVTRIGDTSIETHYKIDRKRDRKVCFIADIVTVCMDLKERKRTAMPKSVREFFEGLLAKECL